MNPPVQESAYELLTRVRQHLPALSPQHQRIAGYLLQNHLTVGFHGIQEMAQECGVPPTTIVHFARRFGYAGFSPFRQLFKDALRQYLHQRELVQACVLGGYRPSNIPECTGISAA
jgi:DNA-binding MurR/RpiR family transcriptional regulator